jgi:heme A synthase
MNEPNPYQSPATEAEVIASPFATASGSGVGIWRMGNVLIMHKMAQLPNICVKTGREADQRVKRTMQWHHPALALLIFAGVLIYVIVALLTRKKAMIEIPVTREWMRGRNRRLAICIAISLLGAVMFGGAIYATVEEVISGDLIALMLGAGVLTGMGGLIGCIVVSPILKPIRITDTHVYLKGMDRELLGSYPMWQGG